MSIYVDPSVYTKKNGYCRIHIRLFPLAWSQYCEQLVTITKIHCWQCFQCDRPVSNSCRFVCLVLCMWYIFLLIFPRLRFLYISTHTSLAFICFTTVLLGYLSVVCRNKQLVVAAANNSHRDKFSEKDIKCIGICRTLPLPEKIINRISNLIRYLSIWSLYFL